MTDEKDKIKDSEKESCSEQQWRMQYSARDVQFQMSYSLPSEVLCSSIGIKLDIKPTTLFYK